MFICSNSLSLNFGSLNNPITPFKYKSNKGILMVKEASQKDLNQNAFVMQIAKFFCKNFATLTTDPYWLSYRDYNKVRSKEIELFMFNYLKKIFSSEDKDLTLLIAKNKRNKTLAACLSYGYKDIPNAQNALYIDSIAIDKKYRHLGLGKMLMNKTMQANKDSFSDVFLASDNLVKKFYEKLGFRNLDLSDKNQKIVEKYIASYRNDYPKYVSLYTKVLDPNKARWYDVVSKSTL